MPIEAHRFITRSTDREAWLEARRGGVTATAVAEAATPSGFDKVVAERLHPVDIEDNPFMAFGRESEAEIMRYAHLEHGVLPSDWLLRAEGNPLHLATPDGLSPDHTLIGEAKTTGTDWGDKPPIKYRRQVQWQLYVTGADRCLFLWQLRVPAGDWFYLGWIEPKHIWIERDEAMISSLTATADRLLSLEAPNGF